MHAPPIFSPTSLSDLLERIDAATAALPAHPENALRELQAARSLIIGRADDRDPDPAGRADVRLTMRERQVLHLLAQGDRNKEIALRLNLRERTVKFHVANLLQKLGAQSRTEALRRAIERGLLASILAARS